MTTTLSFFLRLATVRRPCQAGYVMLFGALIGAQFLAGTLAQTKPPESPKAEITLTGDSTVWGEGPDSYFVKSEIVCPDGSSLIDYEVGYKSKKKFKAAAKVCAKDPYQVMDDSVVGDARGHTIGHRTLLLIRDTENHESMLLCRTEAKSQRLRRISASKLEYVLNYERNEFPK